MRTLIVVALVAVCFAALVSANAAEDEGVRVKPDRCGAKGGHCEVASGCGGRKLPGLCDGNGGDADAAVCCVPRRVAKGKGRKRLSPKQMAAKRKAALALRKKRAKKAAAAAAAMAKQGARAAADAKFAPAKAATKPGTAGDGKSVDFAMTPKPSTSVTPDAPKPAVAGAAKAKAKAKAKKAKAAAKKSKKSKKSKKAKAKKAKRSKRGLRAKAGARGIDVAQKTTKKHWKCLKNAGWDWAVVRGFRASNKPDPHAAASLKHARAAGYGRRKLGVYMFPCAKCGNAKGQLQRMVKHLRNKGVGKLFSTIWLDVEGHHWPTGKKGQRKSKRKPQPRSAAAIAADAALAARRAAAAAPIPSPAPKAAIAKEQKAKATAAKGKGKGKKRVAKRFRKSRAFFRELVKACQALKTYRCGVYTNQKHWQAIMGKRPVALAKRLPLWYHAVDPTPSAATGDFEAFSGWSKPFFKQYSENQNVCGVSVDVNVRA